MTLSQVVDGVTDLDSALFNPIITEVNSLRTSSDNNGSGVYNVLDYGATGDGTTDDTSAIQDAIDAIPAAGGVVFFPTGKYLVTSTLTLTGNERLQGQTTVAFNESSSTPYGSVLITGTSGMTLVSCGTSSALIHHGPRFERMAFRNNAGGAATLVYLENVNHWTFRDCAFRGYNTNGHADIGLVVYSNDSSSGGSLSGGDCSWGMVDNCTFSGLYGTSLQSLYTYGFTVLGGEFTTPSQAGVVALYLRGQSIRVIGAKVDGGLIDIVSEASFYEFHTETALSPAVRVGNQYALPSGSRTCKGNIILGSVTGRDPTPAVGIEIGQYAESTVIEAYLTNQTTAVSEHASSIGTCIRRPGATVQTKRKIASDFAASTINTSTSSGKGHYIETADGSAGVPALHVRTRSGTPIDALIVNNDGSVQLVGTYSRPLILGSYRLWVNPGDDKLYIKSSAPSSATDGTVVGTQS